MNRAIAMHRLHPIIDRTFPFPEAKNAYRPFDSRGHLGKIVIRHEGGVTEDTSRASEWLARC